MPLSAVEDTLSKHFTTLITNIARPETSISFCGLTQLDNIKSVGDLLTLSIIYKYNKVKMVALILVLGQFFRTRLNFFSAYSNFILHCNKIEYCCIKNELT